MNYKDTPYYRVGRATDLEGGDRFIYRVLEILPGFLAWGTIVLIFLASFYLPYYAAIFIIVFDIYWILKSFYLSFYLRQNWKKTKHNLSLDWKERMSHVKYDGIYHMILLPFYNESEEVIEHGLNSLVETEYDKSKFIVVLAGEARNKEYSQAVSDRIKSKYSDKFGYLFCTLHPKDIVGEMPGKGSNIAYAAEQTRIEILDKNNIKYEDVIVSAFDIDTVVYKQYFECLTWNFLTAEAPFKSSFQPIPVFNNNIWQSPALSRVVAFSCTFWQMIQQERMDRLTTFSSHAVCFKTLYDVGYWQKNMVSEDSRIFWNSYLANDGDYRVIPLCYPVAMDANLADNLWNTLKNIYKQQRRWAWGVENLPYVFFGFIKNKNINIYKKIRHSSIMLEGFWSWSTNPIMLFLLGWLPVIIGGRIFNSTVLSYNLPTFTRVLMTISMAGIFVLVWISMSFLPKAPAGSGKWTKVSMILQWIMIPITVTIFGAVPALEAQTRLMLGKYMGFWVTPKHRK